MSESMTDELPSRGKAMTFADLPVGARFRFVGGEKVWVKVLPDRARFGYRLPGQAQGGWIEQKYVDPDEHVEVVEEAE